MRCPKCGYISFDQEEACAKCDASLAEINRGLVGTAVRVDEPFFLASILGQTGQQAGGEEVEFDLAEAEEVPESAVEINVAEEEEGIPMVDLSPFAQQEEQDGAAEEPGISFALPGEETEETQVAQEAQEVAAAAEEDSGMQGTIDFSFGEEAAPEEPPPAAGEAAELDLSLEQAGGDASLEQLGGPVLELEEAEAAVAQPEEALPELELEMGDEAEQLAEPGAEVQAESEELVLTEEPVAAETESAGTGSSLELDIDVDLEGDEPAEEEMVFNLEDIDMSDLVIDAAGGAEEEDGRPEDTALDLEDFLSGGKKTDAGIPMDLTMEDIDVGETGQDGKGRKSADLPDIEL